MGLGFPAGTTSLNAVALIELHHSTLRLSKGSAEFDGDADTAAQPGIGAARAEPNDVPASDETRKRRPDDPRLVDHHDDAAVVTGRSAETSFAAPTRISSLLATASLCADRRGGPQSRGPPSARERWFAARRGARARFQASWCALEDELALEFGHRTWRRLSALDVERHSCHSQPPDERAVHRDGRSEARCGSRSRSSARQRAASPIIIAVAA